MLPLNRRTSKCSERPRMRAHRHCGIIGRSARPNGTTPARPRGVVDEKPQGAQHAGWFTGLRIPSAADASSTVRLISAPSRSPIDHPAVLPLSQLSSFTHERSFASGTRASPGASRVSAEQNFRRHFALALQANMLHSAKFHRLPLRRFNCSGNRAFAGGRSMIPTACVVFPSCKRGMFSESTAESRQEP